MVYSVYIYIDHYSNTMLSLLYYVTYITVLLVNYIYICMTNHHKTRTNHVLPKSASILDRWP